MNRILALALAATACSGYRGSAHPVNPTQLATEPGWELIRDVPFVPQASDVECGAAAIAMVVAYWNGTPPAATMVQLRPVPERGLAASRLRDQARAAGLASYVIEGNFVDLARELDAGRPVIVGVAKPIGRHEVLDHYEVVVGLHRERGLIATLDPSEGWQQDTLRGFAREWATAGFVTVVVSAPAQRDHARMR